jgi:hypothetical protein
MGIETRIRILNVCASREVSVLHEVVLGYGIDMADLVQGARVTGVSSSSDLEIGMFSEALASLDGVTD